MILDTNALSAFADGDKAIARLLAGVAALSVPAVVLGEYRFGVLKSRRQAELEAWLQESLSLFRVLAVTAATSVHYARVRLELGRRGRAIPANDAWIAALALEHRLPIATLDSHFSLVDGVEVVGW